MQTIHDLATKMQAFAANIEQEINEAVNSVEKEIVDLNRKQMFFHQNALGKPLIHNRTGSANLSKAYGKRWNKSKPDIFITGKYQNEMIFDSLTEKTFSIGSTNRLFAYLPVNYDNLHGIAPENRPTAKGYTNWAIAQRIKAKCFK